MSGEGSSPLSGLEAANRQYIEAYKDLEALRRCMNLAASGHLGIVITQAAFEAAQERLKETERNMISAANKMNSRRRQEDGEPWLRENKAERIG